MTGEHNIDDVSIKNKTWPIKSLRLSAAKANPKAVKVLREADIIIFGPGDLFTSILPNLLVSEIREAINKSSAMKVLVTNIMTKYGQTDGFKVADFTSTLENYLRGKIDFVVVNNQKPNIKFLRRHKSQKSIFVEPDIKNLQKLGVRIVAKDLLCQEIFAKSSGDKLKRSLLRHDSLKLAKIIYELAKN